MQMHNVTPSFLDTYFQHNSLEDDSEYFNTGEPLINDFYGSLVNELPKPSAWNRFPTKKNPSNFYKHASLGILYSRHKHFWSR